MYSEDRIKEKAIINTIWKFLESFAAQAVTLVVSIVLARLLEPSDFSVVSLVTAFFAFANIIVSGGLNSALIQKKNADRDDYSTILCFSLIVAAVIYLILFFAAPWLARIYDQEELVPITRVMGLTIPINAAKAVVCAYISSHLQFRKFFFATIGGTIISAIIGIMMARNGYGAWSLVAQMMTNAVVDTIILYCSTRMHLRVYISKSRLTGMLKYSYKILLSNLLGTTYKKIRPLFIGYKFSAAELSFYTKAESFPILIASTTTNTLSAVLFPVLARFQDNGEQLLKNTRIFIRVSSYLLFPCMTFLFVIAETFVRVVLTDKWLPSVPYIRIFCVAYMFEMVHTGNCETIKAMGRSDIYLIIEIIKKTLYFVTIGIFMWFSDSPIVLAFSSIICTAIAFIVNSIPNIRLLGYCFKYQLTDIIPNLIISSLMGFAVSLLNALTMSSIQRLILQVIVGVLVYASLSIITRNQSFLYLLDMIKKHKATNKKNLTLA